MHQPLEFYWSRYVHTEKMESHSLAEYMALRHHRVKLDGPNRPPTPLPHTNQNGVQSVFLGASGAFQGADCLHHQHRGAQMLTSGFGFRPTTMMVSMLLQRCTMVIEPYKPLQSLVFSVRNDDDDDDDYRRSDYALADNKCQDHQIKAWFFRPGTRCIGCWVLTYGFLGTMNNYLDTIALLDYTRSRGNWLVYNS